MKFFKNNGIDLTVDDENDEKNPINVDSDTISEESQPTSDDTKDHSRKIKKMKSHDQAGWTKQEQDYEHVSKKMMD
jgi:hypothetical protein